jgi:hypothetical protein
MKEGFTDVLDSFVRSRLERVHTALPGEIVSYDGHSERKAEVKPRITFVNQSGVEVALPSIKNVPVIFPSSGSSDLLFPLGAGDGCIILFSEGSLGNFLKSTRVVKPESEDRFSLTDAICIPGLWSFEAVPNAPDRSTSTYLRRGDGEIEIDATTKFGVRNTSTDLKSELDKIYGFFGDIADAVSSWVDTGGDVPNPATVALFTTISSAATAAKTSLATLMRN